MQVIRSLDALPAGLTRSVLAIGNFDGVHRGHQTIMQQIRERARLLDAQSLAVTFDPHPMRVLRPDQAPRLITPLPQRLDLLTQTGIDASLVIPFTEEFSRLSAFDFADKVLRQSLHAVEVHEGDNFRFGHGAQAGTAELQQLGQQLGFAVVAHPALTIRGICVSSSEIRRRITAGQVSTARCLLGRPFSIRSARAKGRGIGTRLTVPTINMANYDEIVPANGVYITRVTIGTGLNRETFDAVTNAGNRPTFGKDSYAIESHLLDFRPIDIPPDTPIELWFLAHIRAERRFDSPEALKAQILRDVAKARRYFHLANALQSV
ncbi:MAG: bifunctional riboflavin kinase/FAD synthetase [Silvibacterium sp.]|nr:bifunctional riboflavin kinase/FAD synthetase [Silvibacterium sp.]MBV8435944.1 bifunctional riboflavin kinase/FAD synthetase [Silvibacterium sp.]